MPDITKNGPLKGFTLLELLIVLAILFALVAIAIPTYTDYINKAKLTLAYGALDSMRKNLETYHIDYQQYPATINFETGKDGFGRAVFHDQLVEQYKSDLSSVKDEDYIPVDDTYSLQVRAKDAEQTLLTLTPNEIIR